MSTGDVMGAKKALTMMGRLSRGLESEDEAEDSSIVTKSCRIGEVMIIRSGKRFIVRKVAHSQIAELGMFVFTALFPRIGFCITLCCNALLPVVTNSLLPCCFKKVR